MVIIDGHHLTIEDIVQVARYGEMVQISETGVQNIIQSHNILENILKTGKPVYGINTGFGIFADRMIPVKDAAILSRNLILSHSVGVGEPLGKEIVRGAMLVRANTLAKGFSGIRLEVVETLVEMINRGVTPVVPSQGSLGSSGDLCLLSHLALVFSTDSRDLEEESGQAWLDGDLLSGKEAMKRAGIKRVILGPKEGLALNNGATFTTALAALTIWDAEYLCQVGDASLALTLEALMGCGAAFDERIHNARGQSGQSYVAKRIRQLTDESLLLNQSERVQDAYSLRCGPQVQGAVRDTVDFARGIVEKEINAATDNPLIFDNDQALSGGNFHGEPIGLVMDYLGIAMTELGAISERRIFRLTDGKLNGGLPPMLVDSMEAAGLNSGLMMPHYTCVSLVLENQTLATPDSVHSLPTSGEQEDHNANSMTAARHTSQIVSNTAHILAVELYVAARAIELRLRKLPGARLGIGTKQIFDLVSSISPYLSGDTYWEPEIDRLRNWLMAGDRFKNIVINIF